MFFSLSLPFFGARGERGDETVSNGGSKGEVDDSKRRRASEN